MNTDLNATGQPLPKGWLATVAVIWCGQAASIFATVAASFAAIWFITENTSSPVWLSLASAASLLPVALLSPFGGVVADRFNRKRVMILADGCAGAFSLLLAVAIIMGFLSVPLMLALLAVRGRGAGVSWAGDDRAHAASGSRAPSGAHQRHGSGHYQPILHRGSCAGHLAVHLCGAARSHDS